MDGSTNSGPDLIKVPTVTWLSKSNRGNAALLCLFNKWLALKCIPDDAKAARSILVPNMEKSDPIRLDEWRPITITSIFYRLFASMIAFRVLRQDRAIYCENQRGFLRMDGCLPNTEELSRIMVFQKANARPGLALFIDLKKAFDMIKHMELLNEVHNQLGSEAAALVAELYKSARTNFKGGADLFLTNGVHQGCSFPPLLFNLAPNPLLYDLEEKAGLSFNTAYGTVSRSVLAYEDDLVLFASTPRIYRTW